jgi:phage shock protein C
MPANKPSYWYQKPLYRSTNDRMIAGVLGGLAEYSGVHVTLLRLAFVLLTAFTGIFPGVVGYLIAALIIQPKSAE